MNQEINAQILKFDSLEVCLKSYYSDKLNAEITVEKVKNDKKWLKWLPSVGYDAFRNAPVVSLSFGQIVDNLNRNAERNSKIQSLIMSAELEYSLQVEQVKLRVLQYNSELLKFDQSLQILAIETELFDIVEKSYEEKRIAPTEYLSKKLAFLQKKQGFEDKITELERQKLEVLILAKCYSKKELKR